MSVTATYDDATGKVSIAATAAPAGATSALFERSTDQVTWTQVRGSQAIAVSGSAAAALDYEYAAGVPNFYRVTWSTSLLSSWTPAGDFSGRTATNVPATTTIALAPSSPVPGDMVGVLVSLSAAPTSGTITCTTPGWSILHAGTLGALLTANYQPGLADPVVGVTVATSTALSWYGFRYRNSVFGSATVQANAAATSIAVPGPPTGSGVELVLLAARAASFTAPATPAMDFTDATKGIVADHNSGFWGAPFNITFAAASSATSFEITMWTQNAPFLLREVGSVTPDQTAIWLKNPLRPFLNRTVNLVGPLDTVGRTSRSGVFDIIARTLPVAVTDLMSGQSTSYVIRTETRAEVVDLDLMLAVGEVLFFQPPGGSDLETLYALPGNPSRAIFTENRSTRFTTVPFTEVAMPDLSLAAVQSTWQTVINTYGTWADLIAAKATWADVLLLVGSAADVITD